MRLPLPIMISLLLALSACQQHTRPTVDAVSEVLDMPHRSASYMARDIYRHPTETLSFFDVQGGMSVGEIWPGGGWYAEILAPLLREEGQYYAIGFSTTAARTPQWRKNMVAKLNDKFTAYPHVYDKAIVTGLAVPDDVDIAPEGSLDRVLTFRNVHNWMKGGYADGVFTAMYKALKPGGLLGVVEHRASPGTGYADMVKSGYVTEAEVIRLAEQAGFTLQAKSEVNANDKDTKNHPKGVWTLPPSLRLGDERRAHYQSIGESDRMTLKFIKPAS